MIRKQIYIEAGQQATLARTARLEGTSEAAVIRRAIESASTNARRASPDAGAWEEALAVMRSLERRGARRAGRGWKREDLYERRLKRYDRRSG